MFRKKKEREKKKYIDFFCRTRKNCVECVLRKEERKKRSRKEVEKESKERIRKRNIEREAGKNCKVTLSKVVQVRQIQIL